MRLRFVYPRFARHAEDHPELLESVPCDEYFGPPSLGIASLAASTPSDWDLDFRDDRLEDVGFDDDLDLVAISSFTPAAERAKEIADGFRARGVKVVQGGIFASAMPDEVQQHVDSVVVGEGEGIWPQVLADAASGQLKPRYEASEPVDLANLPLPRVDLYFEKEGARYAPDDYPVQISRGCPLKCVACAIPLSLGRKMRFFPTEHVMGQIAQLGANGKLASLTEDTSFFPAGGAQRRFRELVDAMVESGGSSVSYVGISMPLILSARESLFETLHKSGIKMFYLVGGFDPVTTRAFTGKDEKALQRAFDAIKKCDDHGIVPYTSFLAGNDDDDEGVFDRMLDFADKAKIQKAEFAISTPYPGTPSWFRLEAEGRILHRNWSKYNDANVVFQPKQMSPERLQEGYLELWRGFYKSRQSLGKLEHRERTIQF